MVLAAAATTIWLAVTHERADAAAGKKNTQSDAEQAVTVDTVEVTGADVPIYFQGLGTVQAFYTVTVTPRIDGQLQEIHFTEGQTVHKGDLLALIDPRPNQAALQQAIATKAKDAAQLTNARRDLQRYAALQPEDLASKQTVDTQRAMVDQLNAQLQVDQAQIDSARTQLDYTRITSPITGRTGIRGVDPGNIVHASDTTGIVVVTQVQPITVIFTLPEEDLGTVAAGLSAGPVQISILERETSKILDTGTLSLIDNQIVQATGSAKFKAVFKTGGFTLLRPHVPHPHLWSTTDPYLYHVTATTEVDGQETDAVTERTGFRFFQMTTTDFFLNGVRTQLRGVAKHQETEERASAVTEADLRQDWDNLRDLGVNFVRLAHYPHAALEYDLADERGIVVWAENGHSQPAAPTATGDIITQEMIRQNYNHPSICFWSIGNEAIQKLSDITTLQHYARTAPRSGPDSSDYLRQQHWVSLRPRAGLHRRQPVYGLVWRRDLRLRCPRRLLPLDF